MNLPLRIAGRYLFAKKNTNAINIITGIAMLGISIGAAALVLVLSVFNGFEDLISSMYSNFNPDVKVTPIEGKSFEADSLQLAELRQLEGIAQVSEVLEEIAFFEYRDKKEIGVLKGVDEYYIKVNSIDSTIRQGEYLLERDDQAFAVVGLGMRNKLGVNLDDVFNNLSVYMPRREQSGMFGEPFRRRTLQPSGVYIFQQEYDNQYILSSLNFTRELLGKRNETSALEIKLHPGFDTPDMLADIQQVMGEGFEVKNRYQQEEAFLKLMKIEKWMSFAIVSLMLLLVAFNMVGALWMIVLEKRKDIAILKSMGMESYQVRNIFLNEGLLISVFSTVAGFILAGLIYYVQKNYELVSIPGSFAVNAYPISMRWIDFVIVAIVVIAIGLLASLPPALRAKRVSALVREE